MNEKMNQARAELNELSTLDRYMRNVKRKRDELWTKFTAIRITNYDTNGGHGSCDQEELIAQMVDKLNDLDKKLSDSFLQYEERELYLLDKIKQLPYPYGEVLIRRFVEHQRYEQIAVDMHYDYYYISKRAMGIAIQKYAEL